MLRKLNFPVRGPVLGFWFALCLIAGAAGLPGSLHAEAAAEPPAAAVPADTTPAAVDASAPASPVTPKQPFGALTLMALAGTLFVGLVLGTGVAALGKKTSRSASTRKDARRIEPVASDPVRPAVRASERRPVSQVDEEEEPSAVPVLARLAIPTSSEAPGSRPVERLVKRLLKGPGWGPRIVAFANQDSAETEAAIITQLAEAARRADLDVTIVDCAEDADDSLMEELDLVVDSIHDPHGPSEARIEIVPVHDLLPPGRRPNVSTLGAALRALAARADIVLVRTGARPVSPAIYGAVDEIILLQSAPDAQRPDSEPGLLRYRERIAGAILVQNMAA